MIKIDIRKLADGESVNLSKTAEISIPPGFGLGSVGQVSINFRLTKAGKVFLLEGKGECCVSADCSLCLAPVDLVVPLIIAESYVEDTDANDLDEAICFSDKMIDLLPAIERGLLVNLPMRLLCAPDCAGLCQKCGKNLNEGDCDCGGEINEHFRELLGMFDNKEV